MTTELCAAAKGHQYATSQLYISPPIGWCFTDRGLVRAGNGTHVSGPRKHMIEGATVTEEREGEKWIARAKIGTTTTTALGTHLVSRNGHCFWSSHLGCCVVSHRSGAVLVYPCSAVSVARTGARKAKIKTEQAFTKTLRQGAEAKRREGQKAHIPHSGAPLTII